MVLCRIRIILILTASTLFASAQLQVKNYFSFSGKKDNPVNVICQDGIGFLWLGTNEGIYQFDGKKATDILSRYATLRQPITALYCDPTDKIWIGTKSGKVFIYFENKLDSVDFKNQPNTEKITSFCENRSGVFIGTYGNGIYALTDNRLSHYTSENGLSDNVIYKLESDKNERVWCGTDAGITQLSGGGTKTTFKIFSNKNGLPDNIVRDISYDNGVLLLSMHKSPENL
ncbi:MAG: hypothetical protein HYZ42_14405 [Bacteroidetes bacterium]|nr:hypothetical protein [Bacteroidota bacterium]